MTVGFTTPVTQVRFTKLKIASASFPRRVRGTALGVAARPPGASVRVAVGYEKGPSAGAPDAPPRLTQLCDASGALQGGPL